MPGAAGRTVPAYSPPRIPPPGALLSTPLPVGAAAIASRPRVALQREFLCRTQRHHRALLELAAVHSHDTRLLRGGANTPRRDSRQEIQQELSHPLRRPDAVPTF